MSLSLPRVFWAIIRSWIIVTIFPRFCTKSCVLDSYLLYVLYNHQVFDVKCANLSKFVWRQKFECICFATGNRWLLMDYIFILITCKSQKRKDIFTSTSWHHHIYSVNYFLTKSLTGLTFHMFVIWLRIKCWPSPGNWINTFSEEILPVYPISARYVQIQLCSYSPQFLSCWRSTTHCYCRSHG